MDTVTAARDSVTGAYPNTFDVSAIGPVAVTSPVIDANGDIGGLSTDSTGTRVFTQANGGTLLAAALPAGASQVAVAGIDSTGAVYGSYVLPGANGAAGVTYSFKDSGGTVTPVSGPNGAAGVAVLSVNAAGTVAGTYTDANGTTQVFTAANGTATPVALPAGASFSTLTPIDAAGEVAGTYSSGGTLIGFVAAAGSTMATPIAAPAGTTLQSVSAISGGEVAGTETRYTSFGRFGYTKTSAFYYTAGTGAQEIAPPNANPYVPSSVVGFDATGDVLGTYSDNTSGLPQSFTYNPKSNQATQFTYGGTTPDGTAVRSTAVTGTDASGDIFGTYQDTSYRTYDFVDRGGVFTTVPAPNGAGIASLTGVDAAGDVVGTLSNGSSGPFLELMSLSLPGNASGAAFVDRGGTSTALTVTGQPLPTIGGYGYMSYLGSRQLSYVDPLGQVLGTVSDATGTHAFVAGPGSTATFDGSAGATSTTVYGSDAAGDAAGGYTDAQGQQHVFLRTADGTVTQLDPSTATSASFVGIDAAGAVALTYNDNTGQHAAISANGTLTTITPTGATSSSAYAIDGAGDVLGGYLDSAGGHLFERTAAGTVTQLDPAGSTNARFSYQDAAGDVAGTYSGGGDIGIVAVVGGKASTASLSTLEVGDINSVSVDAAGDAYGTYYDNNDNFHAFYVAAGSTTASRIDPKFDDADDGNLSGGLFSNGAGTVAGIAIDPSSEQSTLFIDANGTVTNPIPSNEYESMQLAGIDAAGDIAGTAQGDGGLEGFVVTAAGVSLTALPSDAAPDDTDNHSVSVLGITSSGLVAGTYNDANGGQHLFATQAGSATATRLDPAGSTNFSAVAGSFSGYGQTTAPANGVIAFNYTDAAGASHGLIDLNGQVTTVNGSPTATSTTLTSVDAKGNITGTYTDAAGVHDFVSFAAATPTISGTHASSTAGEAALPVFSGVTVDDGNANATETLTITLVGASGVLADGAGYSGLKQNADGAYALTGAAAAVTAELDALSFKPAAAGTTTFTLKDVTSVGGVFTNTVTDANTVVTDTAAAAANPAPGNPAPTSPALTNPAPTNPAPTNPTPTNPTPVAPEAVSVSQQVSYKDGIFTLSGTASSAAGVRSVEITAQVDGVATDLGAATVNDNGTFTFQDRIGSATQSFLTATLTDGAGRQTVSADPGFALTGGLGRNGAGARQTLTTADGSGVTTSALFQPGGSRKVDVTAPGQILQSGHFDQFDNHGTPNTTFVFDPGHGLDVVSGFRVGGPDHDTLSFLGADFGNDVADVLRHTNGTAGGVLIVDPTSGDAVKLAGVTKAQLAHNRSDLTFHV